MQTKQYNYTSILVFFCLCIYSSNILFAQAYNYVIDLQRLEKDKVKVTCIVPPINNDIAEFIFPNIIPGSYSYKEYGVYIENFTAYDSEGNSLKLKKADTYNYKILNAKKLTKVSYEVNDSWEEKNGKRYIFQPAGTNFDAGASYVLNHYGMIGYIDGYKNVPFTLLVNKPEGLKTYTQLPIQNINSTSDKIIAPNYDVLSDNPMMLCPPNDTTFMVGNTKITLCLYSETGKNNIHQISEIAKPVALSLKRFFGNLPTDNYVFMVYLGNPANLARVKGKGLSSGYGALEHNNCSFYYMPELASFNDLKESLTDVFAHEFLHILTPLNLHSKEIEDFNFRKPVMSQHLWMYEGVTEYFSQLALLQDSIISMDEFLKRMSGKMRESDYYDKFSYLEMSKNIITPENQNRYLSVYSRGAVYAMMLDGIIINESNGKLCLRDIMLSLVSKYGPDKPFNDELFLEDFYAICGPQVKSYFTNSIIGSQQPNYFETLQNLGIAYDAEYRQEVYFFGNFGVRYDEKVKAYVFYNTKNNILGLQDNDQILSINGNELTDANKNTLIKNAFFNTEEENDVKVKVLRNNQEIVLKASPQKGYKISKHHLRIMQGADELQQRNRTIFQGIIQK